MGFACLSAATIAELDGDVEGLCLAFAGSWLRLLGVDPAVEGRALAASVPDAEEDPRGCPACKRAMMDAAVVRRCLLLLPGRPGLTALLLLLPPALLALTAPMLPCNEAGGGCTIILAAGLALCRHGEVVIANGPCKSLASRIPCACKRPRVPHLVRGPHVVIQPSAVQQLQHFYVSSCVQALGRAHILAGGRLVVLVHEAPDRPALLKHSFLSVHFLDWVLCDS